MLILSVLLSSENLLMTETVWIPVAAAGMALLVIVLVNIIIFKRLRKQLQQKMEDELNAIKHNLHTTTTDELKTYKQELQIEQSLQFEALTKEVVDRFDFELGVLKAKITNNQPSYPKKQEAQQKLAVLVNAITAAIQAGQQDHQQWKLAIQQYLLQYAGFINERTEKQLTLALDSCINGNSTDVMQHVAEAKHQLKETTVAR